MYTNGIVLKLDEKLTLVFELLEMDLRAYLDRLLDAALMNQDSANESDPSNLFSVNALAPQKLREWTRQLCEGVAYMHSRHILHRDLKPQTVLLTPSENLKIGFFFFSSSLE